ncbi:MAG: hypothetical protein IPL71_13735 [Anaerolineales bacterium]|uniref:hypothetical protein n=1 Tax=Candidatus Villigracilis proximus TaxID=3140683 RepID=UPI003135B621|nr:hypothetical protein [Anaerolineales bacterium]
MPNPLQTYLNPPQTVALYQGVVQLLGQDEIIFLSMSLIAQRRRFAFDLPVNLGEYPQKHQEIENSFTRYHNFPDRQGLFFDLINEIQTQLQINGQDLHANRLRDFVSIATAKDFNILISGDCAWIVEWSVANPNDSTDERKIPATVYQGVWKCDSWTVLQYLNGGILLPNKSHMRQHWLCYLLQWRLRFEMFFQPEATPLRCEQTSKIFTTSQELWFM